MNSTLALIRTDGRWIAVGFALALASAFGQTFFIALFSEPLRQSFDLSHGSFGAIYMVATLASAVTIVQLGRLADTWPARAITVSVLLGLAVVCAGMAFVPVWWLLVPLIFGLRLLGQGMLSHLSQTLTARWFVAKRGKALALASFGYPVSEALVPLAAVALILALGWRGAWIVAAGVLALVLAPVLAALLSGGERQPTARDTADGHSQASGRGGVHWTRAAVLRDPYFWCLLPGIMAPGFILTVAFFLPAHIAEVKGWAFTAVTAQYWIYAVTSIAAAFVCGMAIDRFSARACLPFYQLPMALGLLALSFGTPLATMSVTMALFGLTAGSAATLHSALWAEMYGTRHIGAIKALAHAVMVFATAAGPGVAGLLIDLGASFPDQALVYAGYTAVICALYAMLTQKIRAA
ncbi:MAG: MFS transporter [Pseudomonadota bacterium]